MNFKQLLNLLAAVTLPMASAAGVIGVFSSDAKESVRNYMARSNDLMTRNSARALDCFDQYIKSIDQIAKAYQQNHDSCLQASRQGYAQAEEATIDNRNALASSAEESCDLLTRCSGIESAEKVFQCYIAGSSTNGKTMYGINANAAEHLSNLQEEFRLIQNREYKCTNDTKRTYEKDSFAAYDKFNKCNLGISAGVDPTEPPTETEPTEEPETPENTENPEVTEPTKEPENPEVTEAPVETEPTEEPENPEVTEAPVETEPTEEPEIPENTAGPVETEPTENPDANEDPEVTESAENKSKANLPGGGFSLSQRFLSRFKKLRF